MSSVIKNAVLLFAFILLVSCASTGGGSSSGGNAAEKAPVWVTNPNAVYPENEWVTAVEYGTDRQAAQSAAVSALARIFRQDVKSETTAVQRYVDAVLKEDSNSEGFQESREYANQVTTTSDINSLMGVTISDFWTASDGNIYALARINRREAASIYSSIISENEEAALSLISSAEKMPGTFDAYQSLMFASDIAAVNENFLAILSVLDPNMALIRRQAYGNAASVQFLAQEAARNIVISVNITGDIGNRITKAFASCFTGRGFRTTSAGNTEAGYVLIGDFNVEEVNMPNQTNKFARYILTASLQSNALPNTNGGEEILSYSANNRDGHTSFEEARQRSLRTAEEDIAKKFGTQFEEYLASLL